ncbi:hypothetical protein P43SY_007937 [Pythium insidiosum]|uniref:RCK N-terminal domain-containing protein n=1 Tax=Pythium insidiosum TaxID=114742 RepID=A0AAD5Q8C9_PYTIN|nr:hypothetical protein P43SY_007937 [Pythium insidiosum]
MATSAWQSRRSTQLAKAIGPPKNALPETAISAAARSTARKSVSLVRPKRRKREYLAVRASGESFREWVERNLEESYGGYLFDISMAVLGVFMVIFYLVINWNGFVKKNLGWVQDVDFYLNLIFTAEFLLRLYAAHDRLDYMRNPFHFAELLVLLPSWFDFITKVRDGVIPDNAIVEAISGLRPARILRLYRFLEFTTSSLQRQIVAAMLIVVSITISTAGILQVIEDCKTPCLTSPRACGCQSLSMLDYLYFVVVSIATLGYGDITPVSETGKVLIAFIILLTFIVVPIQVNRIAQVISSHTDYSSSYREAKQHPHIILTGYIDADFLTVFFHEFFHPGNLNWNEKVVILNTQPPSVSLKKVLNTVDSKVKYLVGSPMLDEDLNRAVLQDARACYVLVNRNTTRPQYADQCTALITIALRRGNPTCPIYAQVINAQNAPTILRMGATDVVVHGLMKASIMARSCEVFGLTTVIMNLISQPYTELDERQSPIQWQKPYVHGYVHSFYIVDIPRTFSGLTFGDLIRFLYDRTPVIPIGMLTEDGVQLVDMEFKLGATADPNLCCKVYAIAKSMDAVEDVAQVPPEQVLSYRKNMRRKARSAMDLLNEEQMAAERKKIKPALGNEVEKIRQNTINTYTIATASTVLPDDYTFEYEEFATVGVPTSVARHIVVCGFPLDTYQFLKTIREAPPVDDETDSPAVVFLSTSLIDEDEFARIRVFPNIYFVQGSPVHFPDLRRTRLELATSVLILTRAKESTFSDRNMVDADAITTLRYIVEITQRTRMPNVVIELERPSNVKLLSSLANDRRTSTSYTLPTIVSRQLSYRSARRGSGRRDSTPWVPVDAMGDLGTSPIVLEEFVAAGRVYMDVILDSLLSESYRKAWIAPFINVLVNSRPDDPLQRRLFQVEAPDELISLQYGDCFRKLLDVTGCICIGLWRPERGVILPHPCVFVNPPPDLQVEPGDLFYLVGKPFTFGDAQAWWAK